MQVLTCTGNCVYMFMSSVKPVQMCVLLCISVMVLIRQQLLNAVMGVNLM